MHILLVTDGGMQGLEKAIVEEGHTVQRFSIPTDVPLEAEKVFGNWITQLSDADVVILDDKLKRKYLGVIRQLNGSAQSSSEVIENLILSGLRPESIRDRKIKKKRWWHKHGN